MQKQIRLQNLVVILVIFILAILGCNKPNSTQQPSTDSRSDSRSSASEIQTRKAFVESLGEGFNEGLRSDQQSSFSVIGENYDTLLIASGYINKDFSNKLKSKSEIKSKLRQNGFKYVIFSNGKEKWTYDLLND